MTRREWRVTTAAAVGERDETKTAGRGLILIAGAKIYFIVTAYAVHFLLPRLLGEPAVYGLFKQGMSLASILNNILIAATVQTVSKFVSEREDVAPETLRAALQIQLVVGGVLAGALFVLAPAVGWALRDEAVTPLVRIASAVVLAYAVYAALVGSLNGMRLFHKQAGLDVTFSTLRTAGILIGAALGLGAVGAMGGWAAAAVAVTIAAFVVTGIGRRGGPTPIRRWLPFMVPLWAFHFSLNGILLGDSVVLKANLAQMAAAAGMTEEAGARLANEYVGWYGAAQNFAFVPYQLMLSLTFIVFPMISRATSQGDTVEARKTIRGAMRFALLVLVSIAAPIGGAASGVMSVVYPDDYMPGAGALGVLVFGAAALALFVICATAMSAAGRPGTSLTVGLIGLAAVIAGNILWVRLAGIDGATTVTAAAAGTTTGMVLSLLLGGFVIWKSFGAFLPLASVVRAAIAGGGAYAVSWYLPHSGLMAVVALAAGFFAFVALLAGTGELRKEDAAMVRRVLRR